MNIQSLYADIVAGRTKLAVTGLGYVGMPLAVAFAKKIAVIGFDTNAEKIALYRQGTDPTGEVGDAAVKASTVTFSAESALLQEARFHVIAVPTPINPDKSPNLTPVAEASRIVGRNLVPDSVVVYESTVYPGVTEDICLPILEAESGLRCGKDFSIGYSPERINPGDRVHTLTTITKIVSGLDDAVRETIADVYALAVGAQNIYRAPCIKVAEAAKVVENSQRDINIAFMNEIAMAFHRMGINTKDVAEAMDTKWNALGFRPGLVGGHCIGVDPYYLTYEAEQMGYHSRIISAGRYVNDSMGAFVAESTIKALIAADKRVRHARIGIMGVTFKENCPDVRNSKVMDIISRLREYGVEPLVFDPWADPAEVERTYGITLCPTEALHDMDCLVFAVAHRQFCAYTLRDLQALYAPGTPGEHVLIDVKGIFAQSEAREMGCAYWQL